MMEKAITLLTDHSEEVKIAVDELIEFETYFANVSLPHGKTDKKLL